MTRPRPIRSRPALQATAVLSLLIAGVALAAAPRALAPRAASPTPASAPGKGASLTSPPVTRGPATPASPIVSTSDTFLVGGFGFDDRGGVCRTRGWVGEDRAGRVYVHTSPTLVVNQSFFTGRAPASFGVENLTGRLSTTRLLSPRAV